MSEDFSVLIGDPEDLTEGRSERLAPLPADVVERWLTASGTEPVEDGSATWASAGVMVEIYLNLDHRGTLRSLDASLYGADESMYDESRRTFLALLHQLASSVRARVWSESEARFL